MLFKKYFEILQLPITSSKDEIKARFRKLAKLYHPDKHQNNVNANYFIAINEAYNYLIENYEIIQKHLQEEQQKENISKSNKSTKISEEERLKRAQAIKAKAIQKEQQILEQHLKKINSGWRKKAFISVVILSFITFTLLITDGISPSTLTKETISQTNFSNLLAQAGENITLDFKSGQHYTIHANYAFSDLVKPGNTVIIEKSRLFHLPIQIVTEQNQIIPIQQIVSDLVPLLLISFSLPIFTFFYRKRNMVYAVLHLYSLYFNSVLLLGFLLTDNRWLHFITLGGK